MFPLLCDVRQGGGLSPYLFAVYIDDVIDQVESTNVGCVLLSVPMCIILYADDILLIAPSVSALQELFIACQLELRSLDLQINFDKSVCLRIGPRFNNNCGSICTVDGKLVSWVTCIRYLGVYIVSGRQFKCSFNNAKRKFYGAFNAIYGKVGRIASEEVILNLISSKCLPCLLYGSEVCPINRSEMKSLAFPVMRILFKVFKTALIDVVRECQYYFNFYDVDELVRRRKVRFANNYLHSDNFLCQTVSKLFVDC